MINIDKLIINRGGIHMKKQWLTGLVFTAGLALSAFLGSDEASAKVMWDGAEISTGQTGKLAFNKDTKIYKKNADGTFTSMVSKKGSFWRVYGKEQTSTGLVYNMSGGYRVNASHLTTYKEVPIYIQDQVKLNITKHTLLREELEKTSADIDYIELSHLSNAPLQRQINHYVKSRASEALTFYHQLLKERQEDIEMFMDYDGYSYEEADAIVPPRYAMFTTTLDYNSKGYITIGFHDDTYAGGAHGYRSYTAVSYNLATAKQVTLGDFIKTQNQRAKFDRYVKSKMVAANATEDGTFWVEEYTTIDFNTPFYLTDEGVVLVYNPYDMGSYASGMREIYVPFTSFQ